MKPSFSKKQMNMCFLLQNLNSSDKKSQERPIRKDVIDKNECYQNMVIGFMSKKEWVTGMDRYPFFTVRDG